MSDAPRPGRGGQIFAAAALGAAVGATASAGNALLLYTGQGFLRAAGLLFSSTILAIAAGIWAGAADEQEPPPRSGPRWVMLVLTLLLGGMITLAWNARAELRELALGGALAVLFILAVPAYTAGVVLSALHARLNTRNGGGGIAPAALAGAAIGVLVTTMLLIQNLDAVVVYWAAAGGVLLVGLTEARAGAFLGDAASGMNGRVVMITAVGERGQLGYGIAQKFLDAGARLIITDAAPRVEQLGVELAPATRVIAVRADLDNDDDVARVVAAAADQFGRLDALIHQVPDVDRNAEPGGELRQPDDGRHTETLLRVCRAALPLLRESRGAILNIAVPAALRDVAEAGANRDVGADVAAVTRTLALEEKANGVRVNAIAPGGIRSADDARDATLDAVAAVALFLAGPAAASVSGETVRVDG